MTVDELAATLGIGIAEYYALRIGEPWVDDWSARYRSGAENLRAWLAAGRPTADLSQLVVNGPPEFARAVRGEVAKYPAALQYHLVGHVAFVHAPDLDVGGRCEGWRSPILISLRDENPRADTCAHESAHAWHAEPLPFDLSSDEREQFYDAVCARDLEESRISDHVERVMVSERAADCLASAWIGELVDTTSGRHGDRRRQRLRREIAEAAARARARSKDAA